MTGPLLPNGWGRGFAIGATGADGVFETQLRRDGYEEVTSTVGKDMTVWTDFLPWLATVGRKRLFAPLWLRDLVQKLWVLTSKDTYRREVVAFLKRGPAETQARALLAVADLSGEGEKVRALAVLGALSMPKEPPPVVFVCPCGTPGCPTGPECFGGSDY